MSDLFVRTLLGGYPDPLVHKVNRDLFYSSYLQTYLERDVRHVENVQDLSLFQNQLENSRIIFLIRPHSRNISKRIVRSPRIYFFDTGLLSYLLKYPDSNGKEIDLVVDHGYRQDICEVRFSKTVQNRHYKPLLDLQSLFSNPSLYLISAYEERINLVREVRNIPVWETATLVGD